MAKARLGVNIDHVATIRNARGETYPSPLRAALLCEEHGADSVTIHLREDRRHINEKDLRLIRKNIKIPLNLEIAATNEMHNIAKKQKPTFICIVPEKRKEITTEGGLNLNYKFNFLKKIIQSLKKNGSRVSLFINPRLEDVKKAKKLGTDCIEIHTGKLCNLINKKKPYFNEFKKIKTSAELGKKLNLEVHAGHGLTYQSARVLTKIKSIEEYNIGHFLVGESIFEGLPKIIKKFKRIIKKWIY